MTEKAEQLILGVEGGGSKTDWVLISDGKVVDHGQLPAANFILISEDHLRDLFRQLPGNADRAGIFLAGCKTEDDRTRCATLQVDSRLACPPCPASRSRASSSRSVYE